VGCVDGVVAGVGCGEGVVGVVVAIFHYCLKDKVC